MKNIKEYINEAKMSKFKSGLMKCKTFDKLFCYFNNIKSVDELTEDDFEAFDMGFLWFGEEGEDLTFNDFIKKIKSYTGKKVTDIEIDDLGNTENLSFVCDNTSFYVDFVENVMEGHYEDGEWKYNEIETSQNNDMDIDDYLFEYLYTHREEHNWDYNKMKSFMKENFKDWKTEYDLKINVSLESIDKYLRRYCNKK